MERSRCDKERRQDWKKLCKIPSSRRGLILTYVVYTFFVLCVSFISLRCLGGTGTMEPESLFPCGLIGQTLSYFYDLPSNVHVDVYGFDGEACRG
ncbi:uncharacterized protein CLUP02_08538 [Colletotrichum lupini]|uniref:Uncharacterized protein n=1 Tax=Colletotrichum lupini TaxID=145971 RepID=A0A9Q8WHJ8_9PEZI|nr:uncharacterized protein CLUP02_08538 [Colletotrichum lupini]UQC83047.1 hypothetical protein CLUP02_08538 [Colletotrichum lupini]